MNIENYHKIIDELNAQNVSLIAVSKTKPASDIQALYDTGHKDFGENRVPELAEKAETLPEDIRWHMIGNLQRNKVKYIASFVHLIHSVSSLKLLEEINKQAQKHDRVINCLLQLYIAEEESKSGLSDEELIELLDSDSFKSMKHVRIAGLMGMATFADEKDKIRYEFQHLHKTSHVIKSEYFATDDHFKEISMGMSGDYPIAIEEGSTMVRIGSLIFGSRH